MTAPRLKRFHQRSVSGRFLPANGKPVRNTSIRLTQEALDFIRTMAADRNTTVAAILDLLIAEFQRLNPSSTGPTLSGSEKPTKKSFSIGLRAGSFPNTR